jgi:hypothetical protein
LVKKGKKKKKKNFFALKKPKTHFWEKLENEVFSNKLFLAFSINKSYIFQCNFKQIHNVLPMCCREATIVALYASPPPTKKKKKR